MDARHRMVHRHAPEAGAAADDTALPRRPARIKSREENADAPLSPRPAPPEVLPGFVMLSGTIVEIADAWVRIHMAYRFGDGPRASYGLRWPMPQVRVIGSLQAGRHTRFLAPDWLVRDKQAEIHRLLRHAAQRHKVPPSAVTFL